MVANYKYLPSDFAGLSTLQNDLQGFYNALENYQVTHSPLDEINLTEALVDVHLNLKHRALFGALSQSKSNEIESYLESLL